MAPRLAFLPVEVSGIGKALTGLLDGEDGRESVARASAANVVVAGTMKASLDQTTEMVEILAPVHPARFFIPVVHTDYGTLTASVAAVCVPVSGTTSVCSEIIKLLVPNNLSSSMPSVIRANMLTGFSTEVFVVGWDETTEHMVKNADLVLFDSLNLPVDVLLRLLGILGETHVPTVDFNWVRLGMWREEVKRLFDIPVVQSKIDRISRLVVASSGFSPRTFDVSAYTFAGWLIDRLGLEPVAYGHDGWECKAASRERSSVTLQLESRPDAQWNGLVKVEIWTRGDDGVDRCLVSITQGEMLESRISENNEFVQRRAVERNDYRSVVERFFLVGDSTFNYEPAQTKALSMYDLTQGF